MDEEERERGATRTRHCVAMGQRALRATATWPGPYQSHLGRPGEKRQIFPIGVREGAERPSHPSLGCRG